ncbi:hypothetical protein OSG_eHP30_00230 [environmental Halophage eHP-30]|nr:hypothetical protein OSG_eHP30_00230 [environmental Halophage eHP-30]
MPAKTKAKVEGIDDVKKRLKDVKRNSYRKTFIVGAAKKAGKPMANEMKANMRAVPVSRTRDLAKLLGTKQISKKYSGDEFPGAFVGLKNGNKFTVKASAGKKVSKEEDMDGVLNVYWIEFGTGSRDGHGQLPAYSPLRNAIKSTIRGSNRNFVQRLIERVNDQIKKNRL